MSNQYAIWIEDLLREVNKNPIKENIKLIESCGMACAEHRGDFEGILELKKSAKDCTTTKEYIQFLKGILPLTEIENGFIMTLDKEKCTCPLSDEIQDNGEALCYCTQGHEKAIWSKFFGKPVEVELLETKLRGGKDCIIKIIL